MPSIDFNEYAREVRETFDAFLATGEVVSVALRVEAQSSFRGFIEGEVRLANGVLLVVREFVDVTEDEPRLMHAYHCQDAAGELRFRYDNAAHRPCLPQADHKHTPTGIELVVFQKLSDFFVGVLAERLLIACNRLDFDPVVYQADLEQSPFVEPQLLPEVCRQRDLTACQYLNNSGILPHEHPSLSPNCQTIIYLNTG